MANDRTARGKKKEFSDKEVKDRQRAAFRKSNQGNKDSNSMLRSQILEGPKRKDKRPAKSSG